MYNLWLYFLTGLSLGSFTCLAIQGGFLASIIASRNQDKTSVSLDKKVFPVLAFLVSKLLIYTALGFLLGAFGKLFQISDQVRIIMQLLAGVYMVMIALNLLDVHPFFRFFVISPPKVIGKLIRHESHSKALFAPVIFGLLTIFIPCGATLAVEAVALTTGNALLSAGILAAFTLGTLPIFFVIGILSFGFNASFKKRFIQISAALIIYLGIISINGSLTLLSSPLTLSTLAALSPIQLNLTQEDQQAVITIDNGKQVANITVANTGYSPAFLTVKQGLPVHLNLTTTGGLGCTSDFRIPDLNISQMLPDKGIGSVEFTPQKKGRLTFTCSAGLYKGDIDVI